MANPFLAMSEDFSSAQENPALNPFLSGDFGAPTETYDENPFAASNPFSDFGGADYGATVVATTGASLFGVSEPVVASTANFFTTAMNSVYDTQSAEPMFSMAPSTNEPVVATTNFFDTTIHDEMPIPMSTPQIRKPTDLDLTSMNTIADDSSNAYLIDEDVSKPSRPAPPAQTIAPETKDLIMSVTGHMEFTSTHLLDRIPPTRTPSPVSMRDLHSPSPTPDPVYGNFLGDGVDQRKDLMSSDDNEVNLFDVDDVVTQQSCSPGQNGSPAVEDTTGIMISAQEPSPNEEAVVEATQKPPRPGAPPARPMPPRPARPAPPQKPPPPAQAPPQRPQPPKVPPAPAVDDSSNNEFSLFDAPKPQPQPKPTTKEDILSLYAPPKKPEEPTKPIDFLSDDIVHDQVEPEPQPEVAKAPPPKPASPPKVPSPPKVRTPPKPPSPPKARTPPGAVAEKVSPPPPEPKPKTTFALPPEPEPQPQPKAETPPVELAQKIVQEVVEIAEATHEKSMSAKKVPPPVPQRITPDESKSFASPFANKTVVEANPFGAPDVPMQVEQPSAATNYGFDNSGYTETAAFDTRPTVSFANPNDDAFDAFSAKFESTRESNAFDAFGGSGAAAATSSGGFDDAWGNSGTGVANAGDEGFGVDDSFDAFLTLNEPPPVPSGTPAVFSKGHSEESDDGTFNVFIKPREGDVPFDPSAASAAVPILAPPPKSPAQAFTDTSPRFNPFDKSATFAEAAFGAQPETAGQDDDSKGMKRTDSQETPPTPLFDDDVSQPLEDFPRIHYDGPGWEVQLRQPNKKKITGQRFWKKIFIKLVYQGDNPVVQLYNSPTDKEAFQELPLQACYSVSDIAAQQYDQYGKIFTVKLQYVFYKERPGVRPGQVTKAERLTTKLTQFAAYAIQGDYQGVKEFGSDLKKLGLPVEHAPQVSQLFKIGSTNYEDMKQFSMCIEEALFRLNAHRDRALHYKMEEVQITAVDELYVEQDAEGHVMKQIARVRLFFLGFLSGMPDVELGVNDMWRQGKEVVGRHDIIPVATEEWIRLEGVEFHSCIQPEEYQRTRIIRFKPPDACYLELMRFRIRPPKNRELPLQVKAVMCVTGNKVELRADVLVPGFTSRSLGQVPCDDVMIRFPIPECWIYLFRVEKHFRYGSVKSAHRRTGKIKGIERFLGAVDQLQESLIEVTSGQAKYEHQHRSIVWRMTRLPKEGQGAYTTHNLVCRMALTSYDQIPEKLSEWCYVEFTMPATQASHTTVRSVSLQNHDSDEPPEKYVRYLARHEYKVGIEHTQGEGPINAYSAVTKVIKEEPKQPEPAAAPAAPSSDSDSD